MEELNQINKNNRPKEQEAILSSDENNIHTSETSKKMGSSTLKVLGNVADFCNKLPFSGKLVITPVTLAAYEERNPYYKTVRAIEAAGLLGVLALVHASAVNYGMERLNQNLGDLTSDPSPEKILASGIDVAYIAANFAATYSQLHTSGRLYEHFAKAKSKSLPNLSAWGNSKGRGGLCYGYR